MSPVLKSVLAAAAISGMTMFVIAHAPEARAQDQAGATASDDLPPGPDHDLVKSTCTMCHMASQFNMQHKDSAGWNDIVTEMAGMGAVIPPENVPKIVAYLTANFGPEAGAPATPGAAAPATPDAAAPATPPTPDPAAPATPTPAQ